MIGPDDYELRVDAWTPASIPMARLAQYMAELARLLGHAESVHFLRLRKGSTRLESAHSPEAQDDVRSAISRLDAMLREDNAVGQLSRGADNIIRFPGRELTQPERIGPLRQHTECDGVLVRIGGRDETAHAHLVDAEGRVWNCSVSREMARDMAHHLFGAPLRVSGTARWARAEHGEWMLLDFRASDFRVLNDERLGEAVARLRNVETDWQTRDDPLSLLQGIRGSDDEIH